MKLCKVISGGQTGADRTGLECAKMLGIPTGGWAPKGWKTAGGSCPELATLYGLVEHSSADYADRTEQNVKDSEATVWFGYMTSPGYKCTSKAAARWEKPLLRNPTPSAFRALAEMYEILNIAGNRSRMNPSVVYHVRACFEALR